MLKQGHKITIKTTIGFTYHKSKVKKKMSKEIFFGAPYTSSEVANTLPVNLFLQALFWVCRKLGESALVITAVSLSGLL
jgi:hypothetical protein